MNPHTEYGIAHLRNAKLVYLDNEHSRYWVGRRNWATDILNAEDTTYPNGKSAHEIANQVLEEAEAELIEDYAIHVTA